MTRPMTVTANPTSNETWPPYRMRESMSLPFGSVPRMWPGDSGGRPESRTLPPTGLGTG
jgi:hypothetical protein